MLFRSPAMSFIEGQLTRNDAGEWQFCDGPMQLPMNGMAGMTGTNGSVVLGVRPDMISAGLAGAENMAPVRVAVNMVEQLGYCKNVHMTSESGRRLVSRLDGRTSVREGESVTMYIDMNRVHVFEPGESGANMAMVGTGARASVA